MKTSREASFRCAAALLVHLLLAGCVRAEDKWKIHEWGTFTSLQDESGRAIGGINTDDEPVPGFVHRLANFLLLQPTEVPPIFFQGAPSCHPDVTMRMETPVIYFHPPDSFRGIAKADVRVKFRGGWLSEFYPDARADAPGFKDYEPGKFGPARQFQFGRLTTGTESRLAWKSLKVGGDWPLTNSSERVWTSPRAVKAALVQTENGEAERFLFYRGVAHIDAPLKIFRAADQLVFRSHLDDVPTDKPPTIRFLWLVDIRSDGKVAFRALPSVTLTSDSKKTLAQTSATFASSDFSSDNLEKLRTALHDTLVAEGLFADEAHALLNTWELSYFKSPGLRVFFIVPRAWTDFYLPIEVSLPAEINRVMVGRIELVTPEQREALEKLSQFPASRIQDEAGVLWTNFYGRITFNFTTNNVRRDDVRQMNEDLARVNSGQMRLGSFIATPESYQTYLSLGRFRNALVLDAAGRIAAGLTNFISTYHLEAYQPL